MPDGLSLFLPVSIILAVSLIIWQLYIHGYAATQCMAAVLFVCSMRRDRCTASFSYCNGTMRRVLPLRRGGSFTFALESAVDKGGVRVEIQDRHKMPLLVLDESHPTGRIELQKGERCFLFLHFKKAAGRLTLSWD